VGSVDNFPEAPIFAEEAETGLFQAYIQTQLYDEEALASLIEYFPLPDVQITYQMVEAEDKDWNEEWEKNYFQPIVIADRCVISSTFHKDVPTAEYAIKINPQMSFGTGHHATTKMMVQMILDSDLKGKRGLDMGSGTGVLAIAACKCGAQAMDAVDIDDFAFENCGENCATNGVAELITPMLGDVRAIAGRSYDFILANINRNILLGDMDAYMKALNAGGEIFFSGFLDSDIEAMCAAAAERNLTLHFERHDNGWAALSFVKPL
jgi:ribosomal protein L11 methyltransferase